MQKLKILLVAMLFMFVLTGCGSKVELDDGEGLIHIHKDDSADMTIKNEIDEDLDKDEIEDQIDDMVDYMEDVADKVDYKLSKDYVVFNIHAEDFEDIADESYMTFFHDTLEEFLDDNDIDEDDLEDAEILMSVDSEKEIKEKEIEKHKNARLLYLDGVEDSYIKVDGTILYVSDDVDVVAKDTVQCDSDEVYILYKTGSSNWLLWVLLIVLIAIAVYIGIRIQNNKKSTDETDDRVEAAVFCSQCGTKHEAGAKFCKQCGNLLEQPE